MKSIALAAGTGNCLRAVKMLVPFFNGASKRCKVGKLLEAEARLHFAEYLSAAQRAAE